MLKLRSLPLFPLLGPLVCSALLAGCDTAPPGPDTSFAVARGALQSAALSDDVKWAVIGSLQHGASLWRLSDRERLFDWRHQAGEHALISATDIATDAPLAATAQHNTLVLWNTESGKAERYWVAPGPIRALAPDSQGRKALLGLESPSAVLFDAQRGGILQQLPHPAAVTAVALSDDAQVAVVAGESGTATAWSLSGGEKLSQIDHGDSVSLAAVSNDGQWVLTAAKYDGAKLWRSADGQVAGQLELAGSAFSRGERVTAARFSADGRELLIAKSGGTVGLWSVEQWQKRAHWSLPKQKRWPPVQTTALDLAFADSERAVYAVGSDGKVHRFAQP